VKIVVITAITAGRDVLKEHQNTAGADFVAFSDRPLTSATWEIRPACDLFRDPVRNSKIHKILPHLYFPDHQASLWIDATLELADPAPLLVETYLAANDLVLGLHASHQSLDDEIDACLRETLDDPDLIRAQVARYRRTGTDRRFPLASAILRRHTPRVARFNCAWWAEISAWSRRDQLSLLEAAAEVGLEWGHFPRLAEIASDPRGRLLGSPHFRWYSHGPAVLPEPLPAGPKGVQPAKWWARRLEFLEALSGQREAYALSLEGEIAKRTDWAHAAEEYARSLESELERRTLAARRAEAYACRLEEEIQKLAPRDRPGG
jgi:hypothetical protein